MIRMIGNMYLSVTHTRVKHIMLACHTLMLQWLLLLLLLLG